MPVNRQRPRIQVKLTAFHPDSFGVPVQLSLLDTELSVLQSRWLTIGDTAAFDLPKATRYILQAHLPSGITLSRVKDVGEEEQAELELDLHDDSRQVSTEWLYLLGNSRVPEIRGDFLNYTITVQLWSKRESGWEKTGTEDLYTDTYAINEYGYRLDLVGAPRMSMLEVYRGQTGSIFTCLPPQQQLNVSFYLDRRSGAGIFPVAVQVGSKSSKAEAILALLKSSGTAAAKEMLGGPAAAIAEIMLLQKKENPTEAAIGAYYLLKTRELPRMHDWAKNLANLFPWLPDGSVIHAWQLISTKCKDTDLIADRLLFTFVQGIPLYTQGLQLLYDGLLWLRRQKVQPLQELSSVLLSVISELIGMADLEQSLTTLRVPGPMEIWDPERAGALRWSKPLLPFGMFAPADEAWILAYSLLKSRRPRWLERAEQFNRL